jgi:predicted ATPase
MTESANRIRTPDQRLRVFVSSTLRELAPERHAVRSVIERLALTPVMFELGARPHPPRALYRAYLEQSDIFVGIYGEQYGWVAPGEAVSGIEDEYQLVPDVPKLIYIKNSPHRQERLESLLARIRDDDRASYVSFADPDELASLVTADLATLLAERFSAVGRWAGVEAAAMVPSTDITAPPAPLTRLIGRDDEVRAVSQLISTQGNRLVTITGPGGVGKSRLAVAVADEVSNAFPDGVVFVDLAPVTDIDSVVPAIAKAVGLRDEAGMSSQLQVVKAFGHRRILLVLDNFERLTDAAENIKTLLTGSAVTVLATSRILLHIDGEQSVVLTPLRSEAATDLFVERVRAVKPTFQLTDENARVVRSICSLLDNLPLALELAAARARILSPEALLQRLDTALPLLVGRGPGRPERQRTLLATIEWSAQLLRSSERELLSRLGVFRGGFSLDAAVWVGNELDGDDALRALETLVDGSLVQETDRGARVLLSMLTTVREFARTELDKRGDRDRWERKSAQYYSRLAHTALPALISHNQEDWVAHLGDELDEIRATADHYRSAGQWSAVADLVWNLYWFWWATGRFSETREWIAELAAVEAQLREPTRNRMRFLRVMSSDWTRHDRHRLPMLKEAIGYFHQSADAYGEVMVRLGAALLSVHSSPPAVAAAERHLSRARHLIKTLNSPFLEAEMWLIFGQARLQERDFTHAAELFGSSHAAATVSGVTLIQAASEYHLGWASMLDGKVDVARNHFAQQLRTASRIENDVSIAYALEALSAVAASRGDIKQAGRFLGAAENLRDRTGSLGPSGFSYHQPILAGVASGPNAAILHEARSEGRSSPLESIVEEALA